MKRLALFLVGAVAAGLASAEVSLPGEPCTRPAIGCAPFPDRMSAYVWRNWFVVPHARLADAVGATEADLEEIAAQMGLPRKVDVLGEWRRKGYITVLRRNWHLLDYPQLLKVVDMTREELRFSLMEDDFLFVKLGNLKPKCGELRWCAGMREEGKMRREEIARILREEGAADFTEEPRFKFVRDLSAAVPGSASPSARASSSPFDFRMIFSYFADYADPLGDDEVGSYPEGLLQKLAAQGVNAVWLHTVLRTLAKDPKYPEFGEGSERRIANLNRLVKRCAKYGIKVFLYMNEPRAMPDDFFRGHPEREAFRGCDDRNWPVFAMCTSCAEVRRWVRDSLEQVFRGVPGLGGIFTITMSENLTNCASRGNKKGCARCRGRDSSEIVAEINAAMIEGMTAANPDAVALLYDWAWDRTDGGVDRVMGLLPKRNVRVLSVSEHAMPVEHGGVKVNVSDYSISVVGPGAAARRTWAAARGNGIPTAAKVQANCSWELASFPYLPVIDLVAEHALNLAREGVDGVLLSWSHGCCPAPNLSVFRDVRKDDTDKGAVLDRIAAELYGARAVPAVRRAWGAFADGYREFPFSSSVAYNGPQHMGPANPLYLEPTGYRATMVGIPYDAVKSWCAEYPPATWTNQMARVRDGFERGCGLFAQAIAEMPADRRAAAEKELRLFRAATLHFRSSVDQAGFCLARDAKDAAAMRAFAARELETAKALLPLVRGDSSFGYESSNQYFYIPQDVREKILSCRAALDGPAAAGTPAEDALAVGVASSMEAVFPRGPYARKSVAPAAEARLKLARGEHESLQLLVSCPAKDLRNVSVTASDLVRVRPWYAVWAADSIPSGCIDCDVVGYAWAEFPTNSRYSCSHSVCGRTETAPFYRRTATRAVDSWWPDPILDFLPAVDVAAGEYEGTLTVAAEGVAAVRLPFRVRVYGFSVPKASPLPLAITYSPMTHTRDHSAEAKAAAERCAADPEGPVRQAKARPLDWGDFLADYYITFDSLYTHTNLNFEVLARLKEQGRLGRFNLGYWSYFKDGADAEAKWRAETLPRLKANYAKAKELGILDRAYAYGCDEVNTNYFDNIRRCVQILKEELPGVPISTTAYDDEFGVGTQLDVMDWFTPLTPKFDVEKAAASRRAGHQVWWYICCGPGNPWANTFTQCPPLEARMLMGAQTVRMRPDGFLYYEISIWNAERPIDKGPYTDWVPRSYMTLNGDGCWTAVGPGGKPLPTLRLENFRDGLEDYAYAKLLEERIAGRDDADMRVRKAKELLAVPRQVMDTMSNYTNDPAEIAAWRDAMAELIESLD